MAILSRFILHFYKLYQYIILFFRVDYLSNSSFKKYNSLRYDFILFRRLLNRSIYLAL